MQPSTPLTSKYSGTSSRKRIQFQTENEVINYTPPQQKSSSWNGLLQQQHQQLDQEQLLHSSKKRKLFSDSPGMENFATAHQREKPSVENSASFRPLVEEQQLLVSMRDAMDTSFQAFEQNSDHHTLIVSQFSVSPSCLSSVVNTNSTPSIYKSISDALKQANQNDTILIFPGFYEESLTVSTPGLEIKGVVVEGRETEEVVVQSSNQTTLTVKVNQVKISNIRFNLLSGAKLSTILIHNEVDSVLHNMESPNSNNTPSLISIHHCQISSAGCGILVTEHRSDVKICLQDLEIRNTFKSGIYWKHHSFGIISHCIIDGCNCSGIILATCNTHADHFLNNPFVCISENKISHSQQSGIWIKGVNPNHPNVMIQKNTISHNVLPNIVVAEQSAPKLYKNSLSHSQQNGLCIRDKSKPIVQKNQIFENCYPNVYIYNESQPILKFNDIYKGISNGIWIKDTARPQIIENTIYENQYHSILMEGECVVAIENNSIYGSARKGVCAKGKCKGILRQNQIYNNEDTNVELNDESDITVSKNQIYSSKKAGLVVRDKVSVQIICNKIHGNSHPNICIFDYSCSELRDNDVFESEQTGIMVKDVAQPLIVMNRIYGNNFSNLKICGHAAPVIQLNKIYGAQQSGILVKDNSFPKIIENDLYGNQRDNIVVDLLTANPVIQNNREGETNCNLFASKKTENESHHAILSTQGDA